MNILYIITQADNGGAQKYVLNLARYFKGAIAAGTESKKLFNDARLAPELTNDEKIGIYGLTNLKRNINPIYDLLAILEIRKLVKTLNPDIVHLNSSKAGVLGSFACVGLKTKVIFTAHGFIFNEPLPFFVKAIYLVLEKFASFFRDYIITVSDADRKSALNKHLISHNKISTINNGIGDILFLEKNASRDALNLPNDKFILGSVANLYKTKGLDVLIEAVAILPEDKKNKIFVCLIGHGPEETNLKARIKSLKLDKTIFLRGSIEEAQKYLKAFDLFVLSSRKEGFPFIILEAMQAGLPIIATNTGGVAEALENAGIIVEPENSQQLAKAITELINNEQKRKDFSQKSLNRSKYFSEQKMFEETNKIYKKVLLPTSL